MIVEVKREKRITGGMANNGEVLLNIPADMVKDLQKATQDVPYVLSNAASVFGLIQRLTGAGFALDEGELCALCELCERGLNSFADKEGEALGAFDTVLREHMKPWKPEAEE